MVAAEAIVAAQRAGVDMKALRDIVMAGGAHSLMFERFMKVPLADDDLAAQFAIRNARKDFRYYTNMTGELPVTSFMAEAVHQTLVLADNLGYGERFVPAHHRCAERSEWRGRRRSERSAGRADVSAGLVRATHRANAPPTEYRHNGSPGQARG